MRRALAAATGALSLACLACGDTGSERVEIPAVARGSAQTSLSVGAASFKLNRAQVGFGPVYFCATAGAEVELCEVALAELLTTLTIDGLDAQSQPIGTLQATTGSVRSALYDYGISWLLTQQAARPSDGSPGGHSALLDGSVERDGRTLSFSVQVDIKPRGPGDAAVNAQRTSHEISGRSDRLTVAVDPYRWLENVELDPLFALDSDGDGNVVIAEDTQAYQAIVQGMTNGAPVQFVWNE